MNSETYFALMGLLGAIEEKVSQTLRVMDVSEEQESHVYAKILENDRLFFLTMLGMPVGDLKHREIAGDETDIASVLQIRLASEQMSRDLHPKHSTRESIRKVCELYELAGSFLVSQETAREVLSGIGKQAVSERKDQKLKPGWLEHCRRAVEEGRPIATLGDLLEMPGYNHEVANIQPATLRAWAKSVGVTFRSGRPKK